MTVQTRSLRTRSRRRLGRRDRSVAPDPRPQAPDPDPQLAPSEPSPFEREREAGGPEDRASYRCSCGCIFQASVSTSVGCPHCGSAQAW